MLFSRLILGAVLVAHGWQKFSEWTIAGTTQAFEGMGVPAAGVAAVVAAVVELGGGILLILGLFTRITGAIVALQMLAAGIFAQHFTSGVFVGNGGWELVGLIAAGALALVAAGPGAYAVDRFLPKKTTVTA